MCEVQRCEVTKQKESNTAKCSVFKSVLVPIIIVMNIKRLTECDQRRYKWQSCPTLFGKALIQSHIPWTRVSKLWWFGQAMSRHHLGLDCRLEVEPAEPPEIAQNREVLQDWLGYFPRDPVETKCGLENGQVMKCYIMFSPNMLHSRQRSRNRFELHFGLAV